MDGTPTNFEPGRGRKPLFLASIGQRRGECDEKRAADRSRAPDAADLLFIVEQRQRSWLRCVEPGWVTVAGLIM